MSGKHKEKQHIWLIETEKKNDELINFIDTKEKQPRTLTDLNPEFTTYFWLFRKSEPKSYLYLKVPEDEALPWQYFDKNHRGCNELKHSQWWPDNDQKWPSGDLRKPAGALVPDAPYWSLF